MFGSGVSSFTSGNLTPTQMFSKQMNSLYGSGSVLSLPAGALTAIVPYDASVEKQTFLQKVWARLKDMLKVAADVAYKTSIRIFYQQLANVTTEFIQVAGTGQKPIFITDPYYWQKVYDGAKNNFLDSVSTDVFGVTLSSSGAERDRQIGLLARGILNPGTVCEDSCQKTYDTQQARITKINTLLNAAKKSRDDLDPKKGQTTIACPLIGDPTKNPSISIDGTQTQVIDADVCINTIQDLLSAERSVSTKGYTSCVTSCRSSRAAITTDPILKEQIGNQAVAAAVMDMYDPRNSEMGKVLSLLNQSADKASSTVAAEQTAYNTHVAPTRTTAGLITAPASLVENYTHQALDKATNDVDVVTGTSLADTISKAIGNALIQRIVHAWFQSKCGLNPNACKNPTGTSPQARYLFGGSSSAQVSSVQLGTTEIVSGEPSRNSTPTVDSLEANGLIDQKFREAVEQNMTVGDALNKGYLDASRTFGFDQSNNEAIDGYSYQTILYLVQARIVPVGWQLAAEYKYAVSAAPLSLGELVDQFSMCGQDSSHDTNPKVTKYCTGGAKAAAHTECSVDADCVDNGVNYACTEQYTPSPYCGLVDPDWVLKSPLSYCRRQGAGEELLSKTFLCDTDTNNNGRIDCSSGEGGGDVGHYDIQRKEDVCADQPTCVAENEDGSCLTYGYCFEDKRTFRFDGDQCPAYYASCQAYTNPAGESVAYLTKTIDTGGCSSDNAGCSPYCSDRDTNTGTWLCTSDPTADPSTYTAATCPAGHACVCRNPDGESCSVTTGGSTCNLPSGGVCTLGTNYANFTSKAEQCDATSEGCRQFINTTNTTSATNFVANGSFEQFGGTPDDNAADTISGWTSTNVAPEIVSDTDLNVTKNNAVGVRLPQAAGAPGRITSQAIDTGRPVSFQTFTYSFYGKAESNTCAANFGMQSVNGQFAPAAQNAVFTTDWTRYSMTATADDYGYADSSERRMQVYIENSTACTIDVDAVQFEIGAQQTDYVDYGSTNLTYLNGKRRSCSATDVGCETYKPTTGGDAVNGIVNVQDTCPKGDVGCRQFRKEAITHVPERAAEDPVNLVPSTGTVCQASDVGCEEYTNLDKVASGGEAKEYYTTIKQCVQPVTGAADQATFFSWIGDDRSGFQLRSYRLKVSDAGNGAPCTNLTVGTSTSDNNPACEDVAKGAKTCTANDILSNPDCVQFFNSDGSVFYRLESQTIPVTTECHPYRNTIDDSSGTNHVYHILASQSTSCNASAAMCRAFTGNTGNNVTSVASYDFEGVTSISDWEFVAPPAGSAVAISGESLNAQGHSLSAQGLVGTIATSLDGKVSAGSSYTLTLWAKPSDPNIGTRISQAYLDINDTLTYPLTTDLRLAADWHTYTLGPATIPAGTTISTAKLRLLITDQNGATAVAFLDNLKLQAINDSIYLIDNSFHRCNDSSLGCQAYTDRNGTEHDLKSFTKLCSQDVVGCSAVIDTQNSSSPFMSVAVHGVSTPADTMTQAIIEKNALCGADAMGCTAFGSPTMDASKHIRSYDTIYLKDQPDTHATTMCGQADLFCTEFTTDAGTKSYFKDPGAQTCSYKRLSGQTSYHWYITGTSTLCPTITPPQTGMPVGRACVMTCAAGTRAGLACVADTDCPSSSCVGDSDIVGKACTSNIDCASPKGITGTVCDAWVGLCPEEQSGCTEYRDPTDPSQCRSNCSLETANGKDVYVDSSCKPTVCVGGRRDGASCQIDSDCPGSCVGGPNRGLACTLQSQCPGSTCSSSYCSGQGIPGCQPYYYIKNTVEQNASTCNGQIDLVNGCRPFNDTSNPILNYRSY